MKSTLQLNMQGMNTGIETVKYNSNTNDKYICMLPFIFFWMCVYRHTLTIATDKQMMRGKFSLVVVGLPKQGVISKALFLPVILTILVLGGGFEDSKACAIVIVSLCRRVTQTHTWSVVQYFSRALPVSVSVCFQCNRFLLVAVERQGSATHYMFWSRAL